VSTEVDAFNLGQQHAKVFLLRLELPDRRRYLGWRQDCGGDLVQERLENMVVTPVDQQNLDIGSLERARCRNACKSGADDQDTFLWGRRIRHDRLFRRKAFGENGAHLFT
jgi:hypothetical protein